MTTLDYAHTKPRRAVDVAWLLISKRQYALAIVIALILIGVCIRNPSFASADTFGGILANCVQPVIVACGLMLVIVTGEIDISVGASMGCLTAILGILMSHQQYPIWTQWMANGFADPPADYAAPGWTLQPFSVPAAIIITLGLGTLIGFFNGVMVTMVRVPSIIVTLGMMTVLQGLTVMLMKQGNITDVPDSFHFIGIGDVGALIGWPHLGRLSLWIALAVILLTAGMIHLTPIGRRIYAVGSNAHAAALSGISERWVKIFVFSLTGFLVGVATIVTQVAVFDNGTGVGFELLVVTCVVVGGVSINGGVGALSGVVLGVVLLLMQKTVLIFLKLSPNAPNWDKAIQGGLILLAILVDHFARRFKGGGKH